MQRPGRQAAFGFFAINCFRHDAPSPGALWQVPAVDYQPAVRSAYIGRKRGEGWPVTLAMQVKNETRIPAAYRNTCRENEIRNKAPRPALTPRFHFALKRAPWITERQPDLIPLYPCHQMAKQTWGAWGACSRPCLVKTTRRAAIWHPEQIKVWCSKPQRARVFSGTTFVRISSASHAVQRIARTPPARHPTYYWEYRTFPTPS